MDQDNRRKSVRVDCDLPIRLQGEDDPYLGRIVDLSRTGLRLRIPGKSLSVHRLSSLVQVTRQLQDALGDTFNGELHYEMLGPLVNRTLIPCRIAKRDWEQTDVEVGCQFNVPLTDDEVGMLGVPLPAVGTEHAPEGIAGAGPVHRTSTPAPGRPHLRREEAQAYMAYVYPSPGKPSKPLVTKTRTLTRGMAILEVETGQGWDCPDMAVGEVVMALDEAYGSEILMRVVDASQDLWAGPAEVQEVDVHPETHRLKLGVAFGRELRSEELSRLGLPTPA